MIIDNITECGSMKEKHSFVIMIKDKWWREFCNHNHKGRKTHSYVQKGLAPPKNASLIFFYVTKPSRLIAGCAEFIERKIGNAEEMWVKHGSESVLESKEKYLAFLAGEKKVSFVRFTNLQEAFQPIPLNNVLMLLGVKRLARRGFYVDKETSNKLLASMRF